MQGKRTPNAARKSRIAEKAHRHDLIARAEKRAERLDRRDVICLVLHPALFETEQVAA